MKKIVVFLIISIITVTSCINVFAANYSRIVDEADLLSYDQEQELEAYIDEVSEKHKFDQASFEDQQRLKERNLTSEYLLKKAEFERNMSAVILREAQLNLSYCRITAPFDGKVVEILTREHETVRPGQPVCRIIDDNTLLAVMNVPMHDRNLTTVGRTLRIKLDSGQIISGEIYEVSPQADHRTGTVRIKVRIDNRNGALTAGATGELYDGE